MRRFVNRHRKNHAETFIPLDHRPGQRIEADFGEISVDFPDGRRKVNVLILVWSYSNAPFAVALPTQRTEAILEGMTQAFDFFGCVPEEVWWDNPTTVATELLTGRSRKINPRYQALASHYVFDPLFCMPARGNEKPVVENRVKTLGAEMVHARASREGHGGVQCVSSRVLLEGTRSLQQRPDANDRGTLRGGKTAIRSASRAAV